MTDKPDTFDGRTPPIFNEDALRQEIIGKWGEHGAHCEVFDMLLAGRDRLRVKVGEQHAALTTANAQLAALREAVKSALDDFVTPDDHDPFYWEIVDVEQQLRTALDATEPKS